MGSRSSVWKILIALAVVCGLLVFAGGFFHRRALEEKVLEAQAASALYVKAKLAHEVEGYDLSKPLKDADAASLSRKVDPPAGDEVRIFAADGTAVFSTQGIDPFPADQVALDAATSGDESRVIDGPNLRVYAPILGKGQRPLAVAAVVSNYTELRKSVSGPLDALRLPLVGLGVVLLVVGLILMVRATKVPAPAPAAAVRAAAPPPAAKSRVSGFEPVATPVADADLAHGPVADAPAAPAGGDAEGASEEPAAKQRFGLRLGKRSTDAQEAPKEKRSMLGRRATTDEAPEPAPAEASASALDREIAIREALEDQLEQLRTQIKTQRDEQQTAARALTAELEEATRRAQEAEARAELGGAGGAAGRVPVLEQELAQARSVAAEATARAEELQRQAAAAIPDPASEQRMAELSAQLVDAQQRASSAEQRAASVESVRDELEVRVAQLGTKAGELEQRAADLETSLEEANAGGDAGRAEIAALTAALAGANARIQELESMTVPAVSEVDRQATDTEIARLRGELANQMERAQAAEDRIATLEADVLAATRGVSALPVSDRAQAPRPTERLGAVSREESVPPAPAGDDRYDDVWSAPASPTPEPVESARQETARPEPADVGSTRELEGAPVADSSESEIHADPPSTDEHNGDPDVSPDDMWSLRARLAEAAARKRHHPG